MFSQISLTLLAMLILLSTTAFAAPKPTRRCWKCGRDNFNVVNRYRVSRGLKKVKWNWKLASQAAAHSKVMYTKRSMYHSNYGGWENVAYSSNQHSFKSVADEFFSMWRKSPGHNRNMLGSTHRCVGIAIHGDGRAFYGTQIFSNKC